MKQQLIIRESAWKDIEGIEKYLAENASPEVAVDFVKTAIKSFRLLVSQPLMGRAMLPPRPNLEGVRIWPLQIHRGYLLFYKPLTAERGVEILHVFHGARDIARLIDEEEF